MDEVRLIDANALMETIKAHEYILATPNGSKDTGMFSAGIQQAVDEQPTIDPDSLRPKGQWIGEADGYADGELVYDVWYCSECNYCIDDGTDDPEQLPNFCPNCGADMRCMGDD